MNTKLEVVRFLNNDVVATSSHCTIDGISYFLSFDFCGGFQGWELALDINHDNKPGSKDNYHFTFYDEKGIKHDDFDLSTCNWPDGDEAFTGNAVWFHYINGIFYLCDNPSHRCNTYVWE